MLNHSCKSIFSSASTILLITQMHRRGVYCLVFVLYIINVSGYNILGIFPLSGGSHVRSYEPVLKELSKKGHNVTVLGYHPPNEILENYTELILGDKDYFKETLEKTNLPNLIK